MPSNAQSRRGNGPGWGGPAKGTGSDAEPQPPFEPGNTVAAVPHDNRTGAEKRERMIAIYEELAESGETGIIRLMAVDKWLDRHEGKPIARNVNLNVDDLAALDDAALVAERQALERAIRQGDEGGTPPFDAA